MFLFLSATKPSLTMPQVTTLPTGLEASKPALALSPAPETRRYMTGVPAQRMRDSLTLPSTTTCSPPPKSPRQGQKKPLNEISPQNKEFYLDFPYLLTHSWKLESLGFPCGEARWSWLHVSFSKCSITKQLSYHMALEATAHISKSSYFSFFDITFLI